MNIIELAAARKAAYDLFENNADENAAERHFKKGLRFENKIVSMPLETMADILAARDIVLEEYDWSSDTNMVKLAEKILRAI
jgi:hypothetical protein